MKRRPDNRARLSVLICLGVFLIASPALGATFRAVARTGDSMPGGQGVGAIFSTFGNPVINASGQVAFFALPQASGANQTGIWSERAGGLALVAQVTNGPGNGAPFLAIERFPAFNDSATTLFAAQSDMTRLVLLNSGIWQEDSGVVSLTAGTDGPVPGIAGAIFLYVSLHLGQNSAGDIVFTGTIADPSSGVNTGEDSAIWSTVDGSLSSVARFGDPVPGLSGVSFGQLGVPQTTPIPPGQSILSSILYSRLPVIGEGGDLIFSVSFEGAVSSNNDDGIMTYSDGTLSVLARQGDLAPNGGGDFFFEFQDPLVVNASGQFAFEATLQDSLGVPTSDSGLWSNRSGSLTSDALKGDLAPGTPDRAYQAFGAPNLNDAGQLAFKATVFDTSIPGSAISIATVFGPDGAGGITDYFRSGETLPGIPVGTVFHAFSDPELNANGMMIVHAIVGTPSIYKTGTAILAAASPTKRFVVIATGQQFEGSIVSDVYVGLSPHFFEGDSFHHSGTRVFNDANQVAITVSLDLPIHGVFVATVSELAPSVPATSTASRFLLITILWGLLSRLRETKYSSPKLRRET